jgi:uncharacterized protein (DUF58 family)
MFERNAELIVLDRQEKAERKKDARARLRRKLRGGELPTFEEVIEARGLVLRERQDSIFTDAWVPLAVLFVIAGMAAGRNQALLATGLILLAIYVVASWWQQNALVGVSYAREFDRTRAFPGEPITFTIRVSNRKPLPLTWLRFDDRVPVAPVESGQVAEVLSATYGSYVLQNIFSLSGNSNAERSFTFRFPVRGYYRIGPVTYRSGDIFTLFTVEREHDDVDTLVVFPRIYLLDALGLPTREPFGDLKVRQSLFTDPIKTQGIRDYHPRDRFRDIHWKASARRGRLQTKVYDPSTGMNLVVFLNVATMHRHWMGYDPDQLERAISVAASIANYGAEQNWGIGLFANCAVPKSDQPIRVMPGRSPEQLGRVLEALAAASEFATGSIERLMQRESPRLPWPSTLVLVTAHISPDIIAVLLRLKEAGRRVALISLNPELAPVLRGIITYHIPPDTRAFVTRADVGGNREAISRASLASVPVPAPANGEPPPAVDRMPGGNGDRSVG